MHPPRPRLLLVEAGHLLRERIWRADAEHDFAPESVMESGAIAVTRTRATAHSWRPFLLDDRLLQHGALNLHLHEPIAHAQPAALRVHPKQVDLQV